MGNVHMEATQINYREGDKKMSVAQAIKNAGNTGLAHTADIAPDFSAESAYNAGDLVYHNGTLYVFTANHAAGAWSTEDTQAVTVGGELTSLMSGLMSAATDAQKNTDYVGVSYVKVLRIGKLVNVSGRFEVTTEKPEGQGNYLFSGLPAPSGQIIPVYSDTNKAFIISVGGNLTANGVVATQFYNIDVTYSTT